MIFITDFADQAVVLPIAAAILLALMLTGWRRGAIAWIVCVAGVLGMMLLLKLAVFACGWRLPPTGLASPSGHTAAAAVVYGGLLALLVPSADARLAALAGGAFALLVGLTRLALHVHTVADVVLGAAVGVAGAMLLPRLAGARPQRPALPWLTCAAAVAALLVFHGHRLDAETPLRWLALDVWPLSLCSGGSGPLQEAARSTEVAK